MANIGDDTHGTNGQLSLNQSITITNTNLLAPTVYKFPSNITRKEGLEEEYFVDLTAYARLHEKHTRMLSESNKNNKSSQRINELEDKNVRLQQMNDSLKKKLLELMNTSNTNDFGIADAADFLLPSIADEDINPISGRCIACASSLKVVNDPCGHVVYCIDCDKKEENYFLARHNVNENLNRTCAVCRQPILKTIRIYFP